MSTRLGCCSVSRGRDAVPSVRSTVSNAVDSWVGWHQQQPWRSDHMCESGALTSPFDKVALPTETEKRAETVEEQDKQAAWERGDFI